MTGLADDAAAADRLVLGPMVGRDLAGVHGHYQVFRFGHGAEQLPHAHHLRRETAVEADHEQLPGPLTGSVLDPGQFLQGEAERLFAEHVFAGLQGGQHLAGVGVVAGGDDHRVHRRVGQHGRAVGAGLGKAVFFAEMDRAHPATADHGAQVGAGRLEGRNEHTAGVVARTEKGHPASTSACRLGGQGHGATGQGRIRRIRIAGRGRVLQHHTQGRGVR